MKVSVIGAGHVGLVAGACLAEIGHDVLCVDNDPRKLEALAAGRTPFFEPHLEELLTRNIAAGRLHWSASIAEGAEHADVLFLCVGTPPLPDGEADMSAVEAVARQIAVAARSPKLLVEKSTVPVQTGERLEKTLAVYGAAESEVASNPEFLAEGTAVVDFLFPSRIVIGVESEWAEGLLREVYEPIVQRAFSWRPSDVEVDTEGQAPLIAANRNTAEIIKHASNSFLSTKISYINMVSRLCDAVGADVRLVAAGMGLDARIGPKFLQAGIGFGGFCFPKDLQSFIRMAEKNGCDFSLLREIERINAGQVDRFVQTLRDELWILKGKRIAAWGLAFKPHTDDMRFSPAVSVIQRLQAEGARVVAYDPQAADEAAREAPGIELADSAEAAADRAEALLILTDWPQFRQVDLAAVKARMVRPLLLDGRNLLDPESMSALGFEYHGVGRGRRTAMRLAPAV
ncbi:MAG: nucleotide sugar dehydrogenase [Acidobacteria bacterium]|nr:nucleotide sugar dehydrogenase [Acidobacteriota bacterium]